LKLPWPLATWEFVIVMQVPVKVRGALVQDFFLTGLETKRGTGMPCYLLC
jgi:hypothetical protein